MARASGTSTSKIITPSLGKQGIKEGWDYFQSVSAGVFCELGKGEVNFPALLAELKKIGYEGWGVVEQDVLPGMGSQRISRRNGNILALRFNLVIASPCKYIRQSVWVTHPKGPRHARNKSCQHLWTQKMNETIQSV